MLLWIEYIFNFIEFFPRHMKIVLIVGLAYVADSVIAVFCINFDTMYKVLKWTDVMSYVYVVVCLGVAELHFLLGKLLFKYKFRKWGNELKKIMRKKTIVKEIKLEMI